MVRSFAALVGGLIAYLFMLGFVELLFGDEHVLPVEMAFSVAFAVLGGYVTAMIARRSETGHALMLAGLIIVVGVINIASSPDNTDPVGFEVLLIMLSALGALVGGWLRERQTADVTA